MTTNAAKTAATHTTTSRVLGIVTLVAVALLLYLALVVSPPDVVQGNLVRLIYIHPAAATWCYIALGVCALASIAYLWPRTRSLLWDRVAGASGEIGVIYCIATLVTGSIWGRGSWGVWWTWDARLTLTALLCIVFIGYLAVRRSGGAREARARRSAVVAICCFVIVPIDHEATSWWSTLHQGDTLFRIGQGPRIHGWQLVTMLFSFVVFGLITWWMFLHRLALESMEESFETEGFVRAVAERRAEGERNPALAASRSSVTAQADSPGQDVTSAARGPGGEQPAGRPI